jgi:glycosyltransferase involved in cell wall biosynthesis
MRLLYFVDEWPSLFERYLYREMQWMRERGHDAAVICLNCMPNGYQKETKDYVDLAEFDLEDVPTLYLDSKQLSTEAMVPAALAFAELHRAQFIEAHLGREPAVLACQLHLANGIPYAVRLRGGDVHGTTSPKLAEFLHYAAAICPMSQFLADVLTGDRRLARTSQGIPAKVNRKKLRVVPTHLPRHYLAASPVSQSDDIQVIGAIGRAQADKRFQDVIEAVAGLVPEFPGVKLKIIGGGGLLEELQTLASQRCIENRFEITGFQSWAEVMALARQLHIYVQSSAYEGCSLSTIEAGFQGIPLVLSRTGANEQTVEDGTNGYLFDAGDVTTLREHLRSLLRAGAAKREQMGRASLEILGQRFSSEAIMPMIEAICRDAIDNSPLTNLASGNARAEVVLNGAEPR